MKDKRKLHSLTLTAGIFLAILLILPATTINASTDNGGICSNSEFFGSFESGIIPGTICDFITSSQGNPLVSFIQKIVNFVTVILVSFGLISIVIGGYYYMTAGGSSDRIGQAKGWIVSALTGIILALASWLILNTISGQFAGDLQDPVPPERPSSEN